MKEVFEKELLEDILPFWTALVREDGSFPGRMDVDGNIDRTSPVSAVLAFRMLWTFSAIHRVFPHSGAGKTASKVYEYVFDTFSDAENGGVWWSVDPSGTVLSSKKQSYAIGFAIYALSEYALASGSAEAAERAMELFLVLEDKAWDGVSGGYVEALKADWTPLDDVRLSGKDMNAVFTMNTHLHILEAYTNLYRVSSDSKVRASVVRLLEIFRDRIFTASTGHLGLFFSSGWERLDTEISYGHDIEASWLICEALEVVKVEDPSFVEMADRLVACCEEGFRDDGSLVYKYDSGEWDEERHWWVQAEAATGLMKMFRRTGCPMWKEKSEAVWRYISSDILDKKGGEWFWSRFPDGSVNRKEDKAGFWKCPYHNGRMCLELIKEYSYE